MEPTSAPANAKSPDSHSSSVTSSENERSKRSTAASAFVSLYDCEMSAGAAASERAAATRLAEAFPDASRMELATPFAAA